MVLFLFCHGTTAFLLNIESDTPGLLRNDSTPPPCHVMRCFSNGISLQSLSFFIIHPDLSFGGFALKIEFVVFVYELINYLFMKLFF